MLPYSLQIMRYDLVFNNYCTRIHIIDAISGAYLIIELFYYHLFCLLLCLGLVISSCFASVSFVERSPEVVLS